MVSTELCDFGTGINPTLIFSYVLLICKYPATEQRTMTCPAPSSKLLQNFSKSYQELGTNHLKKLEKEQ